MLTCIAYIGPGAGFAFVGSFFLLLSAVLLALASLLTWPARALWALLRRRSRLSRKDVRRVVVLGLDGFDPAHYRKAAESAGLPNLQRLEREGAFCELYSTCPPISPVAWSSFATGANPGKHNIFDFLGRDPRRLTIELSGAQVRADRRGRPFVEGRRKSKSFWTVLGEHGVFSHVFRVPLTFPPERFFGVMQSGLCVPDLRGTQGTFTLCAEEDAAGDMTGGQFVRLHRKNGVIEFELAGPRVEGRLLEARCRLTDLRAETAVFHVGKNRHHLRKGVHSPWIHVTFRAGALRKVSGICRVCLLQIEPAVRLYVSPIQIDPERPPFPIAYPDYYSIYLGKLHGPFATLGLAEDTWALNERVLSEAQFLEQTYDIQREREALFLSMLDRARSGLVVGVFEASDRVQHMFPPDAASCSAPELDEVYQRMDLWVGRVWERLDPARDVLLVVSDHGFTTFRRGVNLNTWLRQEGYLATVASEDSGYLRDVDWGRTRAYAFGLSGIYVNRRGREAQGTVESGEVAALKQELAARLRELRDPRTGEKAIREVYDSAAIYHGPYCDQAPDLIVGFERGYRVSWDGAVGRLEKEVFSDNPKHWQGDHCVDYRLVPGVLFCSRRIRAGAEVHLMDVGPSILRAFGVEPPRYMDGQAFEIAAPGS
jgi:predicted AlkP superfamily phosphohydrolase/phosphomutase